MKKFLSALLAVAMIVSLAAVSFAATKTYPATDSYSALALGAEEHTVKVEDGDVYFPFANIVGPFNYDSEDRCLYDTFAKGFDASGNRTVDYAANDVTWGPVEFGDAAYYAILQYVPVEFEDYYESEDINDTTYDDDDEEELVIKSGSYDTGALTLVTESNVVSNLKIKTEWEEGEDLIKSIKVVRKKILNELDTRLEVTDDDYDETLYYPTAKELGLDKYDYNMGKTNNGEYYYFLVIEYEESDSHNDADIIGTITFNKTKDPKAEDMEKDIGMAIDWEYNYRTPDSEWVIKDDPSDELLANKNYALKFDSDDEIEFTFEDESTFTVDVSGQSKILFNFNTDYIARVAARYPYAELNFWNGNGAKFNRVGEFFFNCEDLEGNQFLYQVNSDGTLSEVAGAEWDDSDEGFYFKTRTLGSYVVSDMELDVVSNVVSTPSAPSVSAPVVTNPATGVEG